MHRKIEKIDASTPDVAEERREQLRKIFPEAWSESGLDFDKLRAALGDLSDERSERYLFSWAGKRDALQLLQTPSRATLRPAPAESVGWDETQNLFIEADNLEALKLLYKPLFNRVKMIYIDPPYNTGNDFIYPDNFADSLKNYQAQIGQRDANGDLQTSKPDANGHIHSRWLSMMYPRLFLARQLLKDDGVIFVSIDDNEVHHLRLLMNEVFGEENFVAQFIWHRRQMADSRNENRASTDHEYVLAFSRVATVLRGADVDLGKYTNPDNDPRGPWFSADATGLANKEQRPNLHYDVVNPITGNIHPPSTTRGWSCSKGKFQGYIEDDRVLWPAKPDGRPRLKKFLSEVVNFQTGFSSMLKVGYTTEGTREIQDLFGDKVIQFPKPVRLIKTLIKQSTEEDDIVLDFFSGSGTTAQAVLELNREDGGNRRFVLVQLPEPTSSAQFPTIAEIGKERIRRVISRMTEAQNGKLDLTSRETPEDLGFKVWKYGESNFRQWQQTPEGDSQAYLAQLELMNDALLPGFDPQSVIYEVALREGYGLNARLESVPEVAGVWRVHDAEKNQTFYVTLEDTIDLELLRPLKLVADDLFICRGIALDDTTAANLALQCRLKMI
jgi:adenine-specific DNA-methyltransferase